MIGCVSFELKELQHMSCLAVTESDQTHESRERHARQSEELYNKSTRIEAILTLFGSVAQNRSGRRYDGSGLFQLFALDASLTIYFATRPLIAPEL